MKIRIENFEVIFAVIGFLFFADLAGIDFMSSTLIQLTRYFIWFGSVCFMAYRWQLTLAIVKRYFCVWLLLGFIVYSFLWNTHPDFILDKNREVLQMSCFALYMSTRFSLLDQVYILGAALGIHEFLSVFYALTKPAIGTHMGDQFDGAWKGILDQKNLLGRFAVLSFCVFLVLQTTPRKIVKNLSLFFMGISAFLVLMTTSMSALANLIMLTGIFFFLRFNTWKGKKQVLVANLLILFGVSFYSIVINNWNEILTAMDRDPTLTGRTYIWAYAMEQLGTDFSKLLLGYGRGVFFDPQFGLIQGFSKYIPGYLPPHAHNGFIDLLLEVGVVGLALFIVCYFKTYAVYLKKADLSGDPVYLLPILFLIFLIIYNITESTLLYLTNLFWMLFLMFIFSSNRGRTEFYLTDSEKT